MLQLTAHQQKSLQVAQIANLQGKIETSVERIWTTSLAQANCVYHAQQWLKSEEGKAFKASTKLGMDELIPSLYPFQKSQYYKLERVGRACFERPDIAEQFKAEQMSNKKQGQDSALSIERFDAWIKDYEKVKSGEAGEAGEAKERTNNKPILVLNFDGRSIGLNSVNMRITATGELKTSSDKKDLRAVVDYLGQFLGMKPTKVEPTKVEPTKATKATKATKKGKKAQILNAADMAFRTEIVDLSEHA